LFFDIITERGIMRKKGYILIVTTIIIALILSGLLYATSIWLRTHATESTEIAQREIALYAAQYGINEMIYNLNTGTTYINGQSISGTTPSGYSYNATYYTGDTFGGTAYIKGVGTASSFKRTIYASIIGGNPEAFKYCLFTQTGGYTKTHHGSYPTITMNNSSYSGYTYNQNGATVPNPDWAWYTNSANYPSGVFVPLSSNSSNTLDPSSYSGKVVYMNYTGTSNTATLTINFGAGNYKVSILTNYPIVNIVWNAGTGNNTTWTPIAYNSNTEYPIFLHNPSLTAQSNVTFNLSNTSNNYKTFTVQGFLYSNSPVTFSYGSAWGYLNINGTLFAKSLTTDWDYNETTFNYTKDYYNNPPPHFGSASGFTYLTGSYREEY
jgi:hypothetical protein